MISALSEEKRQMLCAAAIEARSASYCPYSHFAVGAALLCTDGSIYTGCNIENAAYSPSICAERTAFAKAVSEGHRDFTAIAIAGAKDSFMPSWTADGDEKDADLPLCPPCGVCRQVMMEFCDPDSFLVLLARTPAAYTACSLKQLLPHGFGPDHVS